MAKDNTIQVYSGLESGRVAITPTANELISTTDEHMLWLGDGSKAGAWLVGPQGNFHPGYTSGDYVMTTACVGATSAGTAFVEVEYQAICFAGVELLSLDQLAVNVTTAILGSSCRMALYTNVAGRPDSLIVETAAIPTTSTGVKTAAISEDLLPGFYWTAVQVSVTTIGFRRSLASTVSPHVNSLTAGLRPALWYESQAYGAFPATAAITGHRSRSVPIVYVRIA